MRSSDDSQELLAAKNETEKPSAVKRRGDVESAIPAEKRSGAY
jgi:hypothetical protein